MQPAIYCGSNPFQIVIQKDDKGKDNAACKDASQCCNQKPYYQCLHQAGDVKRKGCEKSKGHQKRDKEK